VSIALVFQWIQAQAFDGDWTGLLGVGNVSQLSPMIVAELGSVVLWDDVGHDGQISYAIARDVSAQKVPLLLDHAGYRYRRILYPWLAGLGGLLPPWATLAGLIAWSAIGLGLAAAGGVLLGQALGLRSGSWLLVILTPGLWLSAQLLTSDVLGFGLAFLGLGLWLTKHRFLSLALLGLAPLGKDQFVLVGIVLALWEFSRGDRRSSARIALASTLPLIAWSLVLELWIGGGFSPRSNFDWPLVGIANSASTVWPLVAAKDLVFTAFALAGVAIALIGGALTKARLLRWSAWAWALVGIVASSWVWDLGNNAVRALAPAMAFGLLALSYRWADPSGALPEAQPLTSSRKNLPV
jgi:hypothetical protein